MDDLDKKILAECLCTTRTDENGEIEILAVNTIPYGYFKALIAEREAAVHAEAINEVPIHKFEREYAQRSKVTVQELHDIGRFAVTCYCEDNFCDGFKVISAENFVYTAKITEEDLVGGGEMKYEIVKVWHLSDRSQQYEEELMNYLQSGWTILISNYSGNNCIVYILLAPAEPNGGKSGK